MSTRAELEAALAKAQADWRQANDELDKAQADRAKANAVWDSLITGQRKDELDQRRADADRRKADEVLDRLIPDQRSADADRRNSESAFAAFSRIVAARHQAYLERSHAESVWAAAAATLITAIAERKSAIAALDELNRAENKV